MTGDDVLRQLGGRLRLQGAAMLFFGTLFAGWVLVANARGGKAAMVGLAGGVLALVGLYRLLRLPIYLRRPDEIARVDRHVPGDSAELQVAMENGSVCKISVKPAEREALALALEQQIGVARLRARVIKR